MEPLNPYARVEAETIAWTSRLKRDRDRPYIWAPGVTTAGDAQSGVYVTRIKDRSYIKVAGVDFGKGASRFIANVRNSTPGAKIELRFDRPDGPVIGTVDVGENVPDSAWQQRTAALTGANGVHDLFLIFRGQGDDKLLFDFDSWHVAP